MITMKQFLETVNYRITEGSEYLWTCYGPNAYSLDSWNGEDLGHSLSMVFDTENQTVYEVTACDYKQSRAYRLINPDYQAAYRTAAKNSSSPNQAWDNIDYTDLEVDEDWQHKAQAIVQGNVYDTRVSIPLDLTEQEQLTLFRMAHERDMTFNDFCCDVVQNYINNLTTR